MDFDKIYNELVGMDVGCVLKDEPLYKHTTFKVGGPTKLYVKVKDIEALKKLISYVKVNSIQYFIIGRGSNLLFSDQQYDGIIISLNEHMNKVEINEEYVHAEAGVSMIKLASDACKNDLSGLEFISGIPGSLGGGVFMNAGAYKSELSDFIETVTYLDDNLEIKTLEKTAFDFSYRHSIFQVQKEWIVLGVTLKLIKSSRSEICDLMARRKERRMKSQPWDLPSAGSVFRNPSDKAAWQYIDDCGLRGKEIGGAQISPKHSNFIVNNGYASAKDILNLIEYVQEIVLKEFGVSLYTEVRLINW